MLRDIAQVSAQNADLTEREVQMQTRAGTLAALLPLAERRARESSDVIGKLDQMSGKGLVSSERLDQALGSQYDSASRLVGLRAEASLLANELPMVARARARAAETLQQLDTFYNGGVIRAGRDGIVGAHVPALGQVVKVGDELLQIYGGQTSVLAYLPESYLFALQPGDRVEVSGGQARAEGTVEALLAVTAALPPEFQSMFRPRDRGRLVRIRLTEEHGLAVAQKVQIHGCAFGWCWHTHPAAGLAASLWRQLAAPA
jgi:multidrug resistance efflux pump